MAELGKKRALSLEKQNPNKERHPNQYSHDQV